MRISYWSSDVCSSDLGVLAEGGGEACLGDIPAQRLADLAVGIGEEIGRLAELGVEAGRGQREIGPLLGGGQPGHVGVAVAMVAHGDQRVAEHLADRKSTRLNSSH